MKTLAILFMTLLTLNTAYGMGEMVKPEDCEDHLQGPRVSLTQQDDLQSEDEKREPAIQSSSSQQNGGTGR